MVFGMDKNRTGYKLLKILADGRFHSGQELGRALSITRSGVWKALRQMEKIGIELHAVTGKGYRLPQAIELLDPTVITPYLQPANANQLDELILLTTIDSTNEYLLTLAKLKPAHTLACMAEHQTAGRGTSGRCWISPFGSNIALSLVYHFNKDPSEIIGLSLGIGVAVIKALAQYGITNDVTLKWPNDVLWQQKKLAGILIDLIAESHRHCSVIIGVGLNLYMPAPLGQGITQPWTHLTEITSQPLERNKLAGLLLNELLSTTKTFETLGLSPFLSEWQQRDSMRNQSVTVINAQGEMHGIMQGISAQGELIVQTQQGEIKHFISGEVRLRHSAEDNNILFRGPKL